MKRVVGYLCFVFGFALISITSARAYEAARELEYVVVCDDLEGGYDFIYHGLPKNPNTSACRFEDRAYLVLGAAEGVVTDTFIGEGQYGTIELYQAVVCGDEVIALIDYLLDADVLEEDLAQNAEFSPLPDGKSITGCREPVHDASDGATTTAEVELPSEARTTPKTDRLPLTIEGILASLPESK